MATVNISVVRARAKMRGSHFFDRQTMRFFNSHVERTAYQHGSVIFFITSEKGEHQPSRLWSIRVMNKDGSFDTVGKFQQYHSLNEAKMALRSIIRNSTVKAEHGYTGIVRHPTSFMIGEAGPERVKITPMKPGHKKQPHHYLDRLSIGKHNLSLPGIDIGNIKIHGPLKKGPNNIHNIGIKMPHIDL